MLLADPTILATCALAVILVGLAKGGFSGLGALGTPLMALVLPPALAAGLLLPILIAQDVVSVWSFRHSWDKWIVGWMLPGAIAGIAAGWAFSASVDEKSLMAALGLITAVFGVYRLWVERGGRIVAASTSPGWVGMLFGALTGLTSQIAHAGGPPFQMWVTPRRLPHLTFAGTNAILFAIINWAKVPGYLALGAMTREVLVAAAMLLPLAILSTLAGVWLVKRLPPQRFYVLIYWLMIGLGSKLVFDAVM
jgi:uncharacterized membrane protein YfcA